MKILIVHPARFPVTLYGGTERVVWCLGSELSRLGHSVTFLAGKGSVCEFAAVQIWDENRPLLDQINGDFDLVHFHFTPLGIEDFQLPYVITIHGNGNEVHDKNTIFVSRNHAERHGSDSFVYNGLDWDDYSIPDLHAGRTHFHFLGKAAWRVKNVQGAIDIIGQLKREKLKVLGGVRFNFKMGIRFTFSPRIEFYGMVGGKQKNQLLNGSKGLIFPVRWHEPFGLAIIESLYFGCPVFGTPYGSLPELVTDQVGFLSNKKSELSEAILNYRSFSVKRCHEYARDEFNSRKMALAYLKKYELVLEGENLNVNRPQLILTNNPRFLDWN
jgi:glycosyltransferase involved in cell wall biosynthesis